MGDRPGQQRRLPARDLRGGDSGWEERIQTPDLYLGASLWLRPVFAETASGDEMPSAKPEELALAILDCLEAGVRILNLSAALVEPSTKGQPDLEGALDQALRRGVIVVAAAGNQGELGSSVITRHPWVIPVAACDLGGWLVNFSNLGQSIGRRGLRAPGYEITSLGTGGPPTTFAGTSAAAPFVTGTVALLWSEFPGASAATVRAAVDRRPWNGANDGCSAAAGRLGGLRGPETDPEDEVP